MNEQELKALWTYLKQIEKNTSEIAVERQKHYEDDLNRYTDLMVAIGTLITEVHSMNELVKNQTSVVKKESNDLKNHVDDSASELKEHIEGNVKVIVKEVDKKDKAWFQFWKKNHSTNGKKNSVVSSA